MRVATAFSIGVSSRISPSTGALWAAGGPAGAAGRVSSPLEIKRSTSALTTRPSGPLPLPAMAARSMPASSAMRRAIGETRSAAVAPEPLPAAALALEEDLDGLRAGAAFGSGSGSGSAASSCGDAAVAPFPADAASSAVSPSAPTIAIGAPSATVSPSPTRIRSTVPAS